MIGRIFCQRLCRIPSDWVDHPLSLNQLFEILSNEVLAYLSFHLCAMFKHINGKYDVPNLSRKRSWVISRDCMPPSNSLKVRNLSPSIFHLLKAAFVSFFFALKIQLRNSIWKNTLTKNLLLSKYLPSQEWYHVLKNWITDYYWLIRFCPRTLL